MKVEYKQNPNIDRNSKYAVYDVYVNDLLMCSVYGPMSMLAVGYICDTLTNAITKVEKPIDVLVKYGKNAS